MSGSTHQRLRLVPPAGEGYKKPMRFNLKSKATWTTGTIWCEQGADVVIMKIIATQTSSLEPCGTALKSKQESMQSAPGLNRKHLKCQALGSRRNNVCEDTSERDAAKMPKNKLRKGGRGGIIDCMGKIQQQL